MTFGTPVGLVQNMKSESKILKKDYQVTKTMLTYNNDLKHATTDNKNYFN